MALAGKYVLLAALLAGSLLFVQAGARAANLNVHRLRSWKRFTATVFTANDPANVEVRLGSGWEGPKLKIPRSWNAPYMLETPVVVLENPDNPDERRLTGFFDMWNPIIVAAMFGLTLLGVAWLVWGATWGADVTWTGGAWSATPFASDAAPILVVHEPRESWIANLFYACVLGLPFGLPPFFVAGGWTPWRAFWALVGPGIFFLLIQQAAENASRTISVSDAGLAEHSVFGTRRVPWDEIAGMEFQDVARQLENLRPWQVRRMAGVRPIEVWSVKDRNGEVVLKLRAGTTPADTFGKFLDQIKKRSRGG